MHAGDGDLTERLFATEARNLATFGYGVKAFVLSMIETAIEVTEGAVPASVIAEVLDAGKAMMAHPVELLDGAAEAVADLASRWPLVLITKGDLFHQESKLARSGLGQHFSRIEIVSEKNAHTYQKVVDVLGIDASDFVMVGDSMRSDVVPALEIGARAIHIPGFREWALERGTVGPEADGRWWRVPTLSDVASLLEGFDRADERY
ncbi:MAG: HAD family hydrolase [Acidimicrobiales bacterium]